MRRALRLALVNPWITDFAAHDLWARPVGLLLLAGLLRDAGAAVDFIDCLQRDHPDTAGRAEVLAGDAQRYGTGKFPKMPIAAPAAVAGLPRRYFRYGLHPETLRAELARRPRPDLIWLSSGMTYWYPGVAQTAAALRRAWPGVPIWLGGSYARLCPDHARRHAGADRVVTAATAELPRLLGRATGWTPPNAARWATLAAAPAPAHDLVERPAYLTLLASRGCPHRCAYCGSARLRRGFERRGGDALLDEMRAAHDSSGVVDFAFHDDALLLDAEADLGPALDRLAAEGPRLRLHTPNGLHLAALDRRWCRRLHRAGFTTLRLGLETARAEQHAPYGDKRAGAGLDRAMEQLTAAGFGPAQIGAYLLAGLPGQRPDAVAAAIETTARAGALPFLSEYSPVPGTPVFAQAQAACPQDLAAEPLLHNNTLFTCQRPDFSRDDLESLKREASKARQRLLERDTTDTLRWENAE